MRSPRSVRALSLACLCLPALVAGCNQQPSDPPTPSSETQAVSLENTHWRLVQIAGQPPVSTPADRAEAYFILMSDGRQMQGFSGCNRMGGPYVAEGRSLKFGAVHATRMACTDPRNPEAGLLQVLQGTAGTRITNDQLELLDANGAALATFHARINPAE